MLDSIRDKFEEYGDYFTEANDAISNGLDKLKDMFRNGAPRLGGFLGK